MGRVGQDRRRPCDHDLVARVGELRLQRAVDGSIAVLRLDDAGYGEPQILSLIVNLIAQYGTVVAGDRAVLVDIDEQELVAADIEQLRIGVIIAAGLELEVVRLFIGAAGRGEVGICVRGPVRRIACLFIDERRGHLRRFAGSAGTCNTLFIQIIQPFKILIVTEILVYQRIREGLCADDKIDP